MNHKKSSVLILFWAIPLISYSATSLLQVSGSSTASKKKNFMPSQGALANISFSGGAVIPLPPNVVLAQNSSGGSLTVDQVIYLTENKSNTYIQQQLAWKSTQISQYVTFHPLSVTAAINYAPAALASYSYNNNTQYSGTFSLSYPGDWTLSAQLQPQGLNPANQGTQWSVGIGNSIQNLIYSSYSHGIKQAKFQNNQTQISDQLAMNQQINNNIASYFQIIGARSSLETAKLAYSQSQSVLAQMQVKYASGMVASLDLQQQQIKTEQAKLAIIIQEQALETSVQNFCFALNIPNNQQLSMTIPDLPNINVDQTLTSYGNLTKQNLYITDEMNQDNIYFNDVQTQSIPNVTVSANYGQQNFTSQPTWFVTFATSYNFLPPQFKGEQDQITKQTNAITKSTANNSLSVGVTQMKQNFKIDMQQYQLAILSRSIAKKQYIISKLKFEAGQASYQDYLASYAAWLGAEQNFVQGFEAYYTIVYQILYPTA
ncbi:MAG: TolC family protein [Fusobacteria bacterium]|nr:TolC family protein [Fusobacteriota bacterium]